MTVEMDAMQRQDKSSIGPLTISSASAINAPSIGVLPLGDVQLIARWRAGESEAGEALVSRYAPALLKYLRRLSGSDHAAEELHQQTWMSIVEHLEKFDPTTSAAGGFKSWLFRIATNKANDTWRSRGRERAAKEGLRLVSEIEAPDASQHMTGDEQADRLQKAISQLPENQRQVLLLRYYSEMKFTEIAEMLGCPLNTALGRMHKAMLKLKELMNDEPIPSRRMGGAPGAAENR